MLDALGSSCFLTEALGATWRKATCTKKSKAYRVWSKRRAAREGSSGGLCGLAMWRAPWNVYESYCQASGSVWQLFGPILALGAGDWVRTADCNPRAATGCSLNSCCWQRYLNYHTIMSILSLFFIFYFSPSWVALSGCIHYIHYCTFQYLRGKSGELSIQYFCSTWLAFHKRRLNGEVTAVGNRPTPFPPFWLCISALRGPSKASICSWQAPLQHLWARCKQLHGRCHLWSSLNANHA